MTVISSNMSLLLFLAILPIIIILLYVYYNDRNKEPMSLLIKLFIAGLLSCVVVLGISYFLEDFIPIFSPTKTKTVIQTLLYSFLGIALIEEISKWAMVYLVGYHNKEFDEVYDGLVYSVFVSLGFAFLENILYVISNNNIYTAIIRALSAVPSHACDAIFMGYHLSMAKEYNIKKNKKEEIKHLLLSILMPTIIHGIYDFCLLSGLRVFVIIFLIFVVFMYYFSITKLSAMASIRKKLTETKHTFCKFCGEKIDQSPICIRCGKLQDKDVLKK